MARTRLLQAACTIAVLAATPAFAQRPEAGMTGPNGQPNPAAQQPAGGSTTPSGSTSMAPANQGGSAAPAPGSARMAEGYSTHHSAHARGAMHGRSDNSQNAEVDRLNEQSFQAAQQGQSFGPGGSDAGSSGTAPPTGAVAPGGAASGGDMSGGSAPSK